MFDLKSLNGTAWLIEPAAIKRSLLKLKTFASCFTMREVAAAHKLALDEARGLPALAVRGQSGLGVGVIPIYGIIEQRMSSELMKLGGTSTEEVGVALSVMMADPNIGSIVLDVDSPGGTSYGVEELADKIHAAGKVKPIHAVANSMAASAGYWLASAATELYVTPGGDVGSVGVYCLHVDESKALEEDGVVVTMISAGEFKTELAPHQPLSKAAKKWMQESVQATYEKFVGSVARGRGVGTDRVLSDFGKGRLLNAQQALAAGMVDGIATFDDVVDRQLGAAASVAGRRSAEAIRILRLRHEQQKRAAGVLTVSAAQAVSA